MLLSLMLTEAYIDGKTEGINIGRNCILINHLLFVDDVFVFCRASIHLVRYLKSQLEQFCVAPSHKGN